MTIAFDNTPVAVVRNPSTGILFTVRLVREGQAYGRDLCLIHDKPEPLVEFYDARYACDPTRERGGEFGQFVSRYYLRTLRTGPQGRGLCLEGSVHDWTLDPEAMRLVHAILDNWTR